MNKQVAAYSRGPPLDVNRSKARLRLLLTSTDEQTILVLLLITQNTRTRTVPDTAQLRLWILLCKSSCRLRRKKGFIFSRQKVKAASYRNKDNRLWNNRNVSPLGEQCKFKGIKKTRLHYQERSSGDGVFLVSPKNIFRFVRSHTIPCFLCFCTTSWRHCGAQR